MEWMEHLWNLQCFRMLMIVGLLLLLVQFYSTNRELAQLLFHTINKFRSYAMMPAA